MGKKRKRPEKDAESASSVTQLPLFDESALSALTNKIESGFRKVSAPGQSFRDRKPSQSEETRIRINKAENHQSVSKDRVAGETRHAHGVVKEQADRGLKTVKSRKDGHITRNSEDQKVLLQEILALGGTEDDLDLVMGVATDEDDTGDTELEQRSTNDPKLAKELSKFITSLGIEMQDIEESSGGESGENVDDESTNIPETSKPELANEVKDVKCSDFQGINNSAKRLNHLVSKSLGFGHRKCCADRSIRCSKQDLTGMPPRYHFCLTQISRILLYLAK